MDLIILQKLILITLLVFHLPNSSARRKSLKIIIPNKVRYVHHHHTHVLVVKDKKPHLQPNAKYHHLHIYDGMKRKNKNVNHHFYIPYIQQPVDDEEEEESVAKYAVVRPNGEEYRNIDDRYVTRKLPSIYEEPIYPSYSGRYRIYDRNSEGFSSSEAVKTEYYEADPFFSTKGKTSKEYAGSKGKLSDRMKSPGTEYEYRRKYLPLRDPDYEDVRLYHSTHMYYPEDKFYHRTRGGEQTYM